MNLQHHFLIAMPALQDPIFRRSVVYICEHNTNGAMGIIVNKPLENLKIEGILEKLKITPEPRDESIRLDKPVMLGEIGRASCRDRELKRVVKENQRMRK